jgi:hypothetical protein
MRRTKALQLLALLLLVMALFGGEVVESVCFVNDVSNDYIQAPSSPAHQLAKKAPANVVPPRSIAGKEELILNLAIVPSMELVLFSSSDLLQFISIQRK